MEKTKVSNRKRIKTNSAVEETNTSDYETKSAINKNVEVTNSEKYIDKTEILDVPSYKTEVCKILSYNSAAKELSIDFMGFGVLLKNVVLPDNIKETVEVKYFGEVGKNLVIEI